MRREPDGADSGRRPGECAPHSCGDHTRIIFGHRPLLPLRYNIHTILLSKFTVTRAPFPIKLEHAKAAVISTRPQPSTDHTPSIAQHPPIRLPSKHFPFVLVITLYCFTTSI